MREILQLDDPEPLSPRGRFDTGPNFTTGETYDTELSEDYLAWELEARGDETEAIAAVSRQALKVLDVYGVADSTGRHAYIENAELHQLTSNGRWVFSLIDSMEGRERCRQWQAGGEYMSWCEDERRYEEVASVHERLNMLFPLDLDDKSPGIIETVRRGGMRLKRAFASVALR